MEELLLNLYFYFSETSVKMLMNEYANQNKNVFATLFMKTNAKLWPDQSVMMLTKMFLIKMKNVTQNLSGNALKSGRNNKAQKSGYLTLLDVLIW